MGIKIEKGYRIWKGLDRASTYRNIFDPGDSLDKLFKSHVFTFQYYPFNTFSAKMGMGGGNDDFIEFVKGIMY